MEELSFVREEVEALPLYVAVEGAGEVAGNGAGRQWEMGDNCSSPSSSGSLSRSSSASHRRRAAFRVRLAGGEAVVAGEGASGGVGDGWDVAVWRGAPRTGGGSELASAVAGARLPGHGRGLRGALTLQRSRGLLQKQWQLCKAALRKYHRSHTNCLKTSAARSPPMFLPSMPARELNCQS